MGSVSTTMDEESNLCINDLWTVRHTPQLPVDLVVASKKVQEIRNWLKSHTNIHRRATSKESTSTHCTYPPPPMLILVGSPGIGKSTCIRCLAVELELEISEWTESSSNYEGINSKYTNPIDSFEQFLQQCGSDITPLTMMQVSHNSNQPTTIRNSHNCINNKVIVIDELPHTHSTDAQIRLQQIITAHIRRRPNGEVPTVFIYSDAPEGKVRNVDLERYINPQTLYEPSLCQIIAINPPTKPKFRQVMQKIVVSERATTIKHNRSYRFPSTNTYIDELYERCNGDVRFAITTLQFEMIGDGMLRRNDNNNVKNNLARSSRCAMSSNRTTTGNRDSKLSPFHALGKLLYAKREALPSFNIALNGQLPLSFDPDVVIQQTDMELGDILYFLSYHSVDFFSDVDDLCTAMTYFSDTSTLCGGHSNTSGMSSSLSSSSSLTSVATSIAGRVVAHANKHPTPYVFRSLSAPKVYDMIRKRRGNQDRIEEYSQRIWLQENVRNAKIGGHVNSRTFGMDLLPYIRTILPKHHISTSYLESMFGSNSMNRTTMSSAAYQVTAANQDVEAMELWKEQEEILKDDDIVEDIDDEDGW